LNHCSNGKAIMIVVTTPTGHIGAQLANDLLAASQTVRVIVRDPDRLSAEIRGKAEIVRGSSDDEAVLDRALAGADSVFHLVPPDFAAPDVTAHYLRFTQPVIAAMKRNRVTRVVTVSGLGRGVAMNAGPVTAAFAKDDELERAGLDVRALWCPGFMENMLRNLDSLRTEGVFVGPSRPDVKRPMVATRDIAAVAARLLLDRSWSGPGGVAVLGPADLSLDEMAAIAGEVLGRSIRYRQVPAEPYKAQLLKYGASEDFAQGLIDMHLAKDRGIDHCVPRAAENTTPTSFRKWCTDVLRPAIAGGAPPRAV
jgi:uncharacterized protein YbjT (DUF2867 family)